MACAGEGPGPQPRVSSRIRISGLQGRAAEGTSSRAMGGGPAFTFHGASGTSSVSLCWPQARGPDLDRGALQTSSPGAGGALGDPREGDQGNGRMMGGDTEASWERPSCPHRGPGGTCGPSRGLSRSSDAPAATGIAASSSSVSAWARARRPAWERPRNKPEYHSSRVCARNQ